MVKLERKIVRGIFLLYFRVCLNMEICTNQAWDGWRF